MALLSNFQTIVVFYCLKKKNSPVATRTFGPATVELKKNKKLKQVSSILNRVY